MTRAGANVDPGSAVLGSLGVAVVFVVLVRADVALGLVAGGALAVVWYLLPAPFAFAFGHVAVVAVLGEWSASTRTLVVELGLLATLLQEVPGQERPLFRTVWSISLITALVGLLWTVQQQLGRIWPLAILLAGLALGGTYALARLEAATMPRYPFNEQ